MTQPKRLKYEKINDGTLIIDLHNDYILTAITKYEQETGLYLSTWYINEKTVKLLYVLEDFEILEFYATGATINSAILKEVANALNTNKFDRDIKNYEYMLACFDRGDDLFEEERLKNIHS